MQAFVKRKGGFLHRRLKFLGIICITDSVVLTPQTILLVQEDKEKNENLHKKIYVWIKKLQDAMKANKTT